VRKQILPFAVLLLFLASNTFAQENKTDAAEKKDMWLKPYEISFVQGAKGYNEQISPADMKQYYIMAETLSNESDFNGMLKEKMAWDKGVPFQKPHPENYRLSVGIIKLNRVMCGAMLRVKFQ